MARYTPVGPTPDPTFADSDDNFDDVDDIVLGDVLEEDGAHNSTESPSPGDISSSITPRSDLSAASSSTSIASKTRYLFPKIDTVESLRPEEVRWFFKEDGDKKWTAFIGYDSLRIECKFREILQRLGNQAELVKEEEDQELINVRGGIYEVNVLKRKCFPIYWSAKGQTASVMRGTWFVDGTWQPLDEGYANQIETEHLAKFESQKIPEDVTDGGKGPKLVVHHMKFKEFHVDWNAINKVYLHSEAPSSKFYRAVGTKLGLAKSGTRLHRGYCYEAHMDDKPPDITHLVFVVHGIGQKMDTGNIVKRCADIRESTRRMKEKFFTDIDLDNKRVEFLPVEWRSTLKLDGDTVESITPNKVKGLRTMLNSSAMDILYYTSPLYRSEITQGLQTEFNRLYVMFCSRHPYFEANGGKVSILAHSLGSVITYDIITGWNPIQLYDQYVSSVIDNVKEPAVEGIISCNIVEEKCHQVESTSTLVSQLEKARQRVNELETEILKMAEKQHLKTPTLKFRLENFFSLGSPLAVFLALRGIRPVGQGSQDHILPSSLCRRLYNIYHPSDPIAYRLEPLILKHYETLMPVRIHRWDSPHKPTYESLPLVACDALKSKNQASSGGNKDNTSTENVEDKEENTGRSTPIEQMKVETAEPKSSGGWSRVFRRNKKNTEAILSAEMTVFEKTEPENSTNPNEDDENWTNLEVKFDKTKTELEYRLDYQLKEGKMENSYLSALTSHTSYWGNMDVALFLLSQIFPKYAPS